MNEIVLAEYIDFCEPENSFTQPVTSAEVGKLFAEYSDKEMMADGGYTMQWISRGDVTYGVLYYNEDGPGDPEVLLTDIDRRNLDFCWRISSCYVMESAAFTNPPKDQKTS